MALSDALAESGDVTEAEREMVRSMCGTKTGIFTGSFETKMP